MSDLIQLTEAEVDLVSGGAFQENNAYVEQYALAFTYGNTTARAGGIAVAVGAAAFNVSLLNQQNRIG